MTTQSTSSQSTTSSTAGSVKPTSRIGGSLLPSSEPRILLTKTGEHGTLQVRPLPELDTYGLFFNETSLLAMHPNGYSCHGLAERILAAWNGERSVDYAMAQFDYILDCGGAGKKRDSIEFIARGLPKHEPTALPLPGNTSLTT
jgi:hypothetical protein